MLAVMHLGLRIRIFTVTLLKKLMDSILQISTPESYNLTELNRGTRAPQIELLLNLFLGLESCWSQSFCQLTLTESSHFGTRELKTAY